MKIQKPLLLGILALSMLLGVPAMAAEEPAYTSSLKEGDFEVRSYPALIAAQVSVTGTRDEASNAGFKLLAGYIFGGNTRKQSIATRVFVFRPAGLNAPAPGKFCRPDGKRWVRAGISNDLFDGTRASRRLDLRSRTQQAIQILAGGNEGDRDRRGNQTYKNARAINPLPPKRFVRKQRC